MRSRLSILRALNDFDACGGASLELVAWELTCATIDIEVRWRALFRDGLIAPVRFDHCVGERFFRLTGAGRRVLDAASE
jgi:hypothetical protein